MSFILDALKKLEQQRQKGSVPDLLTVHSPEIEKPERRTVWPYFLLAALLLNAGILAVFFLPRGSDEQVVTAGGHMTESGPESKQDATRPADPLPPAASQGASSSAGPAEQIISEPAAGPEHRTADILTELPSPLPVVLNGPDSEAPPETKTDDTVMETDDLPGKELASEDRVASLNLRPTDQELESLRTQIKQEKDSVVSSALPDPGPLKEEKSGQENTLSDISQLPSDIRKELPDISISGHIYSNIPGSRLATINGVILRQGDDVIKGLKVDEITLSGVIFSYQGFRFHVRAF